MCEKINISRNHLDLTSWFLPVFLPKEQLLHKKFLEPISVLKPQFWPKKAKKLTKIFLTTLLYEMFPLCREHQSSLINLKHQNSQKNPKNRHTLTTISYQSKIQKIQFFFLSIFLSLLCKEKALRFHHFF